MTINCLFTHTTRIWLQQINRLSDTVATRSYKFLKQYVICKIMSVKKWHLTTLREIWYMHTNTTTEQLVKAFDRSSKSCMSSFTICLFSYFYSWPEEWLDAAHLWKINCWPNINGEILTTAYIFLFQSLLYSHTNSSKGDCERKLSASLFNCT